jgi:pimeloyl-ACP methyl ester carboxylesterase
MSNYTISFAHANGFPAGSYNTLFSYFPDNMKVIALEKYGHSKIKPVNNNWQAQVEELIEHVEKNRISSQQSICLGHSFGGVISFLACCQRPDLFDALIMLDPPVLSGAQAFAARLLKKTPLIDKYSPAGKAENRQKNGLYILTSMLHLQNERYLKILILDALMIILSTVSLLVINN